MPTCPWCNAPVQRTDTDCPSCWRTPDQHPSRSARIPSISPGPIGTGRVGAAAVGEMGEIDDDLDPPLDIALASGRPPPMVGHGALGSLDDDAGDGAGGLPLEIDAGGSAAGAPARAPAPARQGAPPPREVAAPPSAAIAPIAAVDEPAIRALAGFGPPPRSIVDAPLYAWTVHRRRRQLVREAARRRGRLAEAESASADVLARTLEELRPRVGPEHALAALIAPLAQYDEVAAAGASAARDAESRHAGELASIDGRASALEAERAGLEEAAAGAETELERQGEQRARAEAKVKRVDIELRAAHDAARIAAGAGAKFAPPEQAHAIKSLEAERDVRAAELQPVSRAYDSASTVARERRAAVREVRRRIVALREARQKLEAGGKRALGAQHEGAAQAARARRDAYAAAAREIAQARPEELDADAHARIAEAEALVATRDRDLDLCVRAMDAADPEWEKKGRLVLAAALAACLLLLVAVVLAAAR